MSEEKKILRLEEEMDAAARYLIDEIVDGRIVKIFLDNQYSGYITEDREIVTRAPFEDGKIKFTGEQWDEIGIKAKEFQKKCAKAQRDESLENRLFTKREGTPIQNPFPIIKKGDGGQCEPEPDERISSDELEKVYGES